MTDTPGVDTNADETKLVAFVEKLMGGRVVNLTRQPRWRPAWFLDVEKNGEIIHLHARGDRKSNVVPFPELKREADIMEVLGQQGVMVPHIYGYCPDPDAIIMESIRGTRNVAEAASDEERRDISRQYIKAVAAMHRVPIAPFDERGIALPQRVEDIQLAGLNAYYPLYLRVKKKPEPLVEFALAWIRRNIPTHRTLPAFCQYDSGQFLFENGKITGLYDFEFAMICDPMVDLATMRMRESYEPLGDKFPNVIANYEAASGEPVDDATLIFHNVIFSTVAIGQFCGALVSPTPGDPHAVYIEWDISLRRVLVTILAEALKLNIADPEQLDAKPAPVPAFLRMMEDAVARIPTSDEMAALQKSETERLVEYQIVTAQYGAALDARSLDEAAQILGFRPESISAMDAALEAHVQQAGPGEDEKLLRFFHAQVMRDVQVYGPTRIGHSAQNVYLPPLR